MSLVAHPTHRVHTIMLFSFHYTLRYLSLELVSYISFLHPEVPRQYRLEETQT